MRVDITIPTIGESISEATISQILKPSGSLVAQDEEILELETDKVNQVIYAKAAGQITLTVVVGAKVKIGDVIGFIETDVAKAPNDNKQIAPVKKESGETPASSAAPKEVSQKRRKMSSLRKTIAQRLVEVKNQTAMLTTFNEVDMTKIIEIRAKEKDNFQTKYGVKLGFMSFFVKAVVLALKEYPDVGAFLEGDEIVSFDSCNIAVAVSTDKGLMVPVIQKCESLSLAEIEKQIETFAKKARDGTIGFDDLKGGIFTITNGGVFGSLLSTPILNPPQSAILGMHAIIKRPIALNDQIVIRPMMYLALSYDHRIIDGKEAVLFLVRIKEYLENATQILSVV